jgi:YgiT-type zinc finger domain-containing protein
MIEKQDFREFCDDKTKPELVTHTFKREGQKFTFENIKAQVCQKCGESYLDGKAVCEIEKEIREKFFASV